MALQLSIESFKAQTSQSQGMFSVDQVLSVSVHSAWSRLSNENTDPTFRTLAARLTKFTFYTPCSNQGMPSTSTSNNGLGSSISEIKREIPRTIGIYTLKGIVGRMFNLRPMSLKLVWETGEWDPVPGLADDDSWSASDDESTDDGVS